MEWSYREEMLDSWLAADKPVRAEGTYSPTFRTEVNTLGLGASRALPLEGYLNEIILDDPNYKSKGRIDIHSMARGALILAKTEGEIDAKIKRRKCRDNCTCQTDYKKHRKRMLKMFVPKE